MDNSYGFCARSFDSAQDRLSLGMTLLRYS